MYLENFYSTAIQNRFYKTFFIFFCSFYFSTETRLCVGSIIADNTVVSALQNIGAKLVYIYNI